MDFDKINKKIDLDLTEDNSKILIFSDLHFHKHRGSELFLEIGKQILLNILSYADKNNIKTIFFLGDWFHKKEKVGTEELTITSQFLFSLKQRGIKLLMFVGNHDYLYESESNSEYNTLECFNVMDNVFVLNQYQSWKSFNNKTFHFFRWSNDIKKDFIKNKIKKGQNYCFAHWELNGVQVDNNYMTYAEKTNVDPKFLSEHFTKTFLGHYHKPRVPANNVLIIGSPYHQNFNSSGDENGLFVWDIKTDVIKFIKNNSSPSFVKIFLSHLNINSPEDIKKINIKSSFIKIIIDTKINGNLLSQIKEHLYPDNHWVEYVFDYEDVDDLEMKPQGSLKQKLTVLDLSSEASTKKFFQEYINLFKSLPQPLNKKKLEQIIEESVF